MQNPLSVGTHEIDVNGLAQRYHVHGTGPVCVAHPGGPGAFWEYLRMPGLENHLTMVYVEPLGTGESGRLETHPEGYTREVNGAAIDKILDHLGQPKVFLMGHSHGGAIAQRYAVDHSDRLAGLILFESTPTYGPDWQADVEFQVEEFARRHAHVPETPAVVASFHLGNLVTDDAGITLALRGMIPLYLADYWGRQREFAPMRAAMTISYLVNAVEGEMDDRALLPRITAPTLIVVGRYDFVTSVRWAEELHALIPGSRLEIFENSGHMAHAEEPERFTEVIAKFVKDQE